jgi:hypothetical protein
MTTKKSHELIILLDDYGDLMYDANLFPFKEYNSYEDMEKLTVLHAVKDLIDFHISLITTGTTF